MNIPLTPIRFLRYAEQQSPQRTAVVCGKERFTYAQFAERASRLAGALRKAGVRPGDRVAFLSANCHRLLEAYYGVVEAGAVLLPLNIRLAPQELAYILNDSGACALFVQRQFLGLVESFRSKLTTVSAFYSLDGAVDADWVSRQNYEALLSDASPHRADIMQVDENSLAELFYTSGTSAEPKGVMLTHRNIYLHALSAGLALQADNQAVELHTIPLFHANGWGVAHFLTLLGGKHVMVHKFDPPEVFRLIEAERAQYCSLVPAMATALVNCPERPKYDLSSLKRVTLGGAASSPTLVREVEEKLGCTCFSGYGLTETSPVLTISPMKPGIQWEGEQRYVGQSMTGYAIPGTELRVVDQNDQDVPRDGQSIGEIIARSDGVLEGYWRQPQATAEALRGGWFHTGDMATWREDGYLLIVDRKKDIIVSGGENISSLEVEKILLSHPAVLEVAVVPVPDRTWGEVPMALVVLKPGAQLGEAELIEHCRARLAHYKCPRSVEFLESLPRTGTGKVLKRDLRRKYWHGSDTIRPDGAARNTVDSTQEAQSRHSAATAKRASQND
ncbi:MAG TPA: long-chain-fatty-acid--CoA ligase [Candidatus Angelobacter sp.]|nr:long-chain-fatty-acid--CoA ligase [Candidatus Angelobacter sp.]